jgi:beta-phosphoglucomutase family hydrolase
MPDFTPAGLVFDCDGTLADTMPLHWLAWRELAERHRLEFPETRFYSLGGVPTRDIVRMLALEQDRPELDPMALAHEKEQLYLRFMPEVGPIEEVVSIAREHRGRIPMAVASGGSRHAIRNILEHLDIIDWFDAVVTNEDVVRQKPAPDIFLEAARRIGIPPTACRGFEDTDLGMEAIRSAGMDAVDVRFMRTGLPAAAMGRHLRS